MIKYFISALFFLIINGYAATDPTMPPNWNAQVASTQTPKDIVVSGIFTNDNHKTAVVNEKNMKVGDSVQGYEITNITKNDVHFKNNRSTFVVPLTSKVKTPVVNKKELNQNESD